MSNVYEFYFEELPLVIHNGTPAGLVNGCASIRYTRDGDWEIDGICVEGYQNLTPEQRAAGKRPWIYVPAPTELEMLIEARLEAEWYGKVECALQDHLADEREAAREYNLEARRDDRRMGF